VLLITSNFETGPTVGLEALATGLPVMTTNVGEVAGIVARSGAGAVSSSRDPGQLAAELDELLARPRRPLAGLALVAAQPFGARSVLQPVYDLNRFLAARLRAMG
jgi:glycosyltransferase involved in cell wall biosynthesis